MQSAQPFQHPGHSCSICLDPIKDASFLPCAHSFCWPCITQWYAQNRSCPICRTRFRLLQVIRSNIPEPAANCGFCGLACTLRNLPCGHGLCGACSLAVATALLTDETVCCFDCGSPFTYPDPSLSDGKRQLEIPAGSALVPSEESATWMNGVDSSDSDTVSYSMEESDSYGESDSETDPSYIPDDSDPTTGSTGPVYKCHALLKSGPHRGDACRYSAYPGNNGFCRVHRPNPTT